MINREYYLNQLANLYELDDIEAIHAKADDILLEVLCELGFADIAEAYNKIEKWYA